MASYYYYCIIVLFYYYFLSHYLFTFWPGESEVSWLEKAFRLGLKEQSGSRQKALPAKGQNGKAPLGQKAGGLWLEQGVTSSGRG